MEIFSKNFFSRMLRILLRRNKSIYEHLNVPEETPSGEIFAKINEISKAGGVIDSGMAKEIHQFKTDRFSYDVIDAVFRSVGTFVRNFCT